ncbi:MAG: hypothetical protein GEU96_06685 [Propionibacteriales bacterium]|nr:hypothetical protein [Propionibacteriales bacterium]
MYWGSGALSVLVGVVGGVLLVCSVLLGRRRGWRRGVGVAGAGLMLLGLSLSGLIDALARALSILSFNPLRWIGLAAAVLGFVLLSWSGIIPRRRKGRSRESAPVESGREQRPEVGSRTADASTADAPAAEAPAVDDDLAEIEEILRRRGIS